MKSANGNPALNDSEPVSGASMEKEPFKSHTNGNRARRLAVFDLDGTLTAIRSPFIYVSDALGCGAEARAIAAQYWSGNVDYRKWGEQIVALWKGTREEVLRGIVAAIPFRRGAETFIRRLQLARVAVGIISVAFQQHVIPRANALQVDVVQCNTLQVRAGRLTGGFTYTVDDTNKQDVVTSWQHRYGVTAEQTMVAGDTEGDIPMFSVAALSIAVDPESDNVLRSASTRLPGDDWSNAVQLIETQQPNWLPLARP